MAKNKSKIADAAAARESRTEVRSGTQVSAVDPGDLHAFVSGAVSEGALVSFASTRDGSAVVLTILHDDIPGGKFKEYFDEEGLADEISYWASVFKG